MKKPTRFGVALSGGGYRAAAFHLGTLRALNRLGLLQKIDVLSTISGGSITGAAYCLNGRTNFDAFEQQMVRTLATKSVIRAIVFSRASLTFFGGLLLVLGACVYLLFTPDAWTVMPILAITFFCIVRFEFVLFPISRQIERAYDRFFFKKRTLKDLPDKPELVIGSTNLQTSTPFIFSRRKMEDSNYRFRKDPITFLHQEFPVARAVVASSCVPFAFTPVSIRKEFFTKQCDYKKINPKLVDGEVFDNQGIHKVTAEASSYFCQWVLVSDAGNKLPFEQSYNNTIILLIRTVNVFMDRIKGFQMAQNLYKRDASSLKEIAYQSLGWDLSECIRRFVQNMIDRNVPTAIVNAHGIRDEWKSEPEQYQSEIEHYLAGITNYPGIAAKSPDGTGQMLARNVGTNLTRLSKAQISALMSHADAMTELQLKLYCPALLAANVSPST